MFLIILIHTTPFSEGNTLFLLLRRLEGEGIPGFWGNGSGNQVEDGLQVQKRKSVVLD
jgi:hypothetical protein